MALVIGCEPSHRMSEDHPLSFRRQMTGRKWKSEPEARPVVVFPADHERVNPANGNVILLWN